MADSVNFWHWWISLKINVNFWDWVRDTYYDVELLHLANDVDCQTLEEWADPTDDQTIEQFVVWKHRRFTRRAVKRLMNRYGDEIIRCCLGLGDPEKQGMECLSELPLAFQVTDRARLEEFLLRNALRRVADHLLNERPPRVRRPGRLQLSGLRKRWKPTPRPR
jgi:hypothetical protein